MKAACIVEPGRVEIRDVPSPRPRTDEVLVDVKYVGLCGSDLNTFRGRNPMVSFPRIPGHEVSGVIVECGAEVPEPWRAGVQVTLSPYTSCGECPCCRRQRPNCCRDNRTLGVQRDGALTQRLAVPWRKLFTSQSLSLRELALVEPLTVGGHAIRRAHVGADDTVTVLGCGAIGLGAIAGAHFVGGRVIAVDVDDAKLELARKAGASETVNSARQDLHDCLQGLTDDDGPDVVVEAIGLPVTFRAAVEEVGFAGRVVYIGYAKEPVEYETRRFVQKELAIYGSRNALPEDFAGVIELLESGGFPARAVVSRVTSLDRVGEALADWQASPTSFTKILVEVN